MLGKLIGAVAGYWLGGFIGLLFGLFLGHLVDRRLSPVIVRFLLQWMAQHQVHVQRAFFETTFSVMGHVAKADGRVSEQEIAMARQVMAQLGLDEAAQRQAIDLFNRGKQPDFDFDGALRDLKNVSHGRRNLIQVFIEIQLGAAFADGTLDEIERDLLVKMCQALDFPLALFERLEAMIKAQIHSHQTADHRPTLEDAYAMLDVDENATDAEVKRAYRRLTSQHHPDKLVSRGLPKEMIKMAEEKTREIREAYERIRDARGFK